MQNETTTPDNHYDRFLPVILAGLAGGLTEIIWITFYSSLSSTSAADVAGQIAVTVLPVSAGGLTPALGVAIHLVLSIVLATAFVLASVWPHCTPVRCHGCIHQWPDHAGGRLGREFLHPLAGAQPQLPPAHALCGDIHIKTAVRGGHVMGVGKDRG